jgi:hypothetical protein
VPLYFLAYNLFSHIGYVKLILVGGHWVARAYIFGESFPGESSLTRKIGSAVASCVRNPSGRRRMPANGRRRTCVSFISHAARKQQLVQQGFLSNLTPASQFVVNCSAWTRNRRTLVCQQMVIG